MTSTRIKVSFTSKGKQRTFFAKPRIPKYATTRLMVKALHRKDISDAFIAQAVMKREKCNLHVAHELIDKLRFERDK